MMSTQMVNGQSVPDGLVPGDSDTWVTDTGPLTAGGKLIVFLPAKAGVGSTTLALNIAGSLANRYSGKKVLLLETDSRSGVLSIMLNLAPEHSFQEIVNDLGSLARTPWSRALVKRQTLDLITSPRTEKAPVNSPLGYQRLFELLGAQYDLILVDLPDATEDTIWASLRCARRVFVVTTPDLPSLALAQRRREELETLGVAGERVSMVLNRWRKDDPKTAVTVIEQLLEESVGAVFPEDYNSVQRAIREGNLVDEGSQLGKSFAAFADQIVGGGATASRPKSVFASLRQLIPGSPRP